eukprot:scaffold2807_cov336-Prasinococcus_capsulatus_cf.AAC.4
MRRKNEAPGFMTGSSCSHSVAFQLPQGNSTSGSAEPGVCEGPYRNSTVSARRFCRPFVCAGGCAAIR